MKPSINPIEFAEKYAIKSLACCFSGGKDSLVATHYVMTELEDFDIDKYVVYVDTGVMLPTTTPYVESVCREFGWNLKILYGNFFEKAKVWGMPTMRRRWCCYECKLKPIIEFVKPLRPQRAEITGLRRDESFKRAKLPQLIFGKATYSWKYAPIISWVEKDVLAYIRNHKLRMPPNYRIGIKETCQCGCFSSRKQLLALKGQFPELFQRFIELEKQFKKQGSCFFCQGEKIYAKDLAKQKTLG